MLAVADAYACVRVLSDSIATLPLKVVRRTDAGRVPAGGDQRLVQLLRRPSPGSTSVDLISQLVTQLNVYGDAFLAKWKSDREIVQLSLLHPDRVDVKLEGQRVVYTLDSRTEHGPDDILHVKAMSLDGVRGMSPVAQCRTALGLNESLRESSRQFFEEGSRPSGILTVPLGSSADAMEREHETLRSGRRSRRWKQQRYTRSRRRRSAPRRRRGAFGLSARRDPQGAVARGGVRVARLP